MLCVSDQQKKSQPAQQVVQRSRNAAALVAAATAAAVGLLAAVVVKVDNRRGDNSKICRRSSGSSSWCTLERFAATAIAAVLDGHKSTQSFFASVRTTTSAPLSTLARHLIGRDFLDSKQARPEPVCLEIRFH